MIKVLQKAIYIGGLTKKRGVQFAYLRGALWQERRGSFFLRKE